MGSGCSFYLNGLKLRATSSKTPTPTVDQPQGGKLEFEVGDKVIYPNHGIGVVKQIETKTIFGTTCGFYSLRMASSDTTVLVPLDNVEGVGLRGAIADHEVKKLFTLLGNGKIDNHQNWKGRFKDNSDKMRTGVALRRRGCSEEPQLLEPVQEPVFPREADARPREVSGRV